MRKLLTHEVILFIGLLVGLSCFLVGCSTEQFKHQSLKTTVAGKGKIKVEPSLDDYQPGDELKFVAQPADGWLFYGWQGDLAGIQNPQTLLAEDNTQVKAKFIKKDKAFTLKTAVEGEGKVEVEPEQEIYQAGEEVTVTAKPAEDWTLYYWGKDLAGNQSSQEVVMDEDKEVKANFIALDKEISFADDKLENAVKNELKVEEINIRNIRKCKTSGEVGPPEQFKTFKT